MSNISKYDLSKNRLKYKELKIKKKSLNKFDFKMRFTSLSFDSKSWQEKSMHFFRKPIRSGTMLYETVYYNDILSLYKDNVIIEDILEIVQDSEKSNIRRYPLPGYRNYKNLYKWWGQY